MKKGFTLDQLFDRDDVEAYSEALVDLFNIMIKRRGDEIFTFIVSPSGEEIDITNAMNFSMDTYQSEIKEKVLNYIMRTYVFKNEDVDDHYYRYDEVNGLFNRFHLGIKEGKINLDVVLNDSRVMELDSIFQYDIGLYLSLLENDDPKILKMAKTPGVCIRLGKALNYILKRYM